ncbi:MAG: UDP-2,3-diacylglucosamine diphosphatase [Elusimicrobiota bacterium]
MSSVFTADSHLKVTEKPEAYQNFTHFLNKVSQRFEKLYILGDLFSYWFEHPRLDLSANNPAVKALRKVSEKGLKVYFIYGNRDFAAGEYFKANSGVKFLGESLVIDCAAGKAFLSHGDNLVKQDIRYQIWRRIIRSPWAAFIFKNLPVSGAVAFADAVKRKGKGKISYKTVASMIEHRVPEEFRKGYDVIIAGHAHYKMQKHFNIDGQKKFLYLLPEYSYPGEFLVLNDKGEFDFKRVE